MEIIITIGIVALAAFFLYKSAKKKAKGGCTCDNCTSLCPLYDKNKRKT